ncbi:MAG: hypothetical protein ABIG89_05510 [Candidatus Woesearchaeota archaeon]
MITILNKIRRWWVLRKTKKLEKIKLPNEKTLADEHDRFLKEAQELDKMITKPTKKTKRSKTIVKKKKKNL